MARPSPAARAAMRAEREYLKMYERERQDRCDSCGEPVTAEEAQFWGEGMQRLTLCPECGGLEMPRSWDHLAVRLDVEELLYFDKQVERWNESDYRDIRNPYLCSSRCALPVTHAVLYSYVTGRAGRVSRARRYTCFKHALSFSKKYQVEIQEESS